MPPATVRLRLIVTGAALVLIAAHLVFPKIKFDTATLVLLGLGVLPWLAPLIRRAQFPGGFEIEFQDLKAAADRIAASPAPASALTPRTSSEPLAPEHTSTWQAVHELDPNLALVGLRIEIERRLRDLAKQHLDVYAIPLPPLIERLGAAGVLGAGEASGLTEIVLAGNQAAHGARVDPAVREWAQVYGPRVLQVLDSRLDSAKATA